MLNSLVERRARVSRVRALSRFHREGRLPALVTRRDHGELLPKVVDLAWNEKGGVPFRVDNANPGGSRGKETPKEVLSPIAVIGDVDQQRAILDSHREYAHIVGPLIEGPAGFEVEARVMPLAGEDTALDRSAVEREAHVRAPRLDLIQRAIGRGCHLTRRVDQLVSDAGLEIARLDRCVIAGMPKTHSTMYRGTALARK